MGKKDENVKIPKSVLDLRMSEKKFAKKNDIRIKGKELSKREKKHNEKMLRKEYSEFAISGLDKAVKILAKYPDHKKADKIKDGVDNILSNPDVMKRITKIYKNDPEGYPNLIYLPYMIMNTLVYYNSDGISEEEKEIGKSLNTDELIEFCEKILKKQIKRYRNMGMSEDIAFQLSTVIPTTKLFDNRKWYRILIHQLYDIAEKGDINIDEILMAVSKIDKKEKDRIKRKEFLDGFFSEFLLQKDSNRKAKYNDSQKRLHEDLIDRTLIYLDNVKQSKLRDILKRYIKRRQKAESYKNDTRRVIKFTDHANSNSPYSNIKQVVQDLIAENSSNELYLS